MSKRAEQIAKEIKKILSPVIQEQFPDSFVSVYDVLVLPDLTKATIWVTITGPNVFGSLLSSASSYRQILAKVLKMRRVPEIDIMLVDDEINKVVSL